MDALYLYIMKSAALMAVFIIAYYALLRNETFFRSNRGFLLGGLITSVILPLVTFDRIVWVEASTTTYEPVSFDAAVPLAETASFDWDFLVIAIYLTGFAICLLKFLIELWALHKMLANKQVICESGFKFVDVPGNISPFSWFNTIVYNSSLYSVSELQNILEHEKVHSRQWHSADVLLGRLFCIVFWFSPFAWLYKKAMLQNLEFIADSEATKAVADVKSYQLTLLKITTHDNCISITNHFFQSLIKKRIVMLNKNQSSRKNSWKYVLVMPMLAAFMLYFQVNVIAQERRSNASAHEQIQEKVEVIIDKNTSDDELKSIEKLMKDSFGVDLRFSKVKRNRNNEIIAIKANFKDNNGKKGVSQISSDEPIKPLRFYKNGNNIGFGASPSTVVISNDNSERKSQRAVAVNGDDGGSVAISGSFVTTGENGNDVVVIRNENATGVKVVGQPTLNVGGGKNPVIIVNGKRIADGENYLKTIDPEAIALMSVISANAATAAMGEEASDGIIQITTKEMTRNAMKQAEEAIKQARIEIERAKPEMERAREAIAKARPEIERARAESGEAKLEIEQAKKEMEIAREEIRHAKAELEKARAELKKAREENKR
ncbi:MAG: M56 family peptidase [Flavobacterium sp.]|nr:M56 family peptidase [Flavobacterium sp.]